MRAPCGANTVGHCKGGCCWHRAQERTPGCYNTGLNEGIERGRRRYWGACHHAARAIRLLSPPSLSPRLCMVPSPFQLLHHSWARSIHLLLMGVTDRQTGRKAPNQLQLLARLEECSNPLPAFLGRVGTLLDREGGIHSQAALALGSILAQVAQQADVALHGGEKRAEFEGGGCCTHNISCLIRPQPWFTVSFQPALSFRRAPSRPTLHPTSS